MDVCTYASRLHPLSLSLSRLAVVVANRIPTIYLNPIEQEKKRVLLILYSYLVQTTAAMQREKMPPPVSVAVKIINTTLTRNISSISITY